MKRSVLAPVLALLTMAAVVFSFATAAQAAQTAGLRLEPLGDSITYGTASSTGNGYRQALWNELTGEGHLLDFVGTVQAGPMSDPDNEGHPGYRIDQIAALTDASLAAYKPNVVTLMAGTNDLIQNYQVSTAPARLSALVDQIVADDPTATVLVATLIVGTNAGIVAGEPAFNAAIPAMVQSKQAAGKHVALVSMSALTTADLVSDGIHPNDGGYQKMADAWNSAIQAAAGNGWISTPIANGAAASGVAGPVKSALAGKCLDDSASNTADGNPVQLWTCNGTGAQAWAAYSDGTLRVFGKCLNAAASGTANGTKTQLATCNGSGAQVWQSYNGGYRNLVSGRCLDDPAGSTTDGTQLELWDCNGGTNQQWTAPQAPTGPVTSAIAGKCADDNGAATANGTAIQIWDCNGSSAQQWKVAPDGTLHAVGKCMDVTGGGAAANGTKVELYDCNGTGAQVWSYNTTTKALVNPASGRCLDDPNSSTTNGTQLIVWDCNGGTNQKWTLPTS